MVADNSQEAENFIFTIMDTKNNDFRAIEFGLNSFRKCFKHKKVIFVAFIEVIHF